MRNRIYSFLIILLSVFTCQQIMAASSSRKTANGNLIFSETFSEGIGNFTVEGERGDNNNLWFVKSWGEVVGLTASACGRIGDKTEIKSILVSPSIKLTYTVSAVFEHGCMYFSNIKNEVYFCIREVGGEWESLNIPNFPTKAFVSSGDIAIPQKYEGKEVQFGFKYTAKVSDKAGDWTIRNFCVYGNDTPASKKEDPQLSFNVAKAEYTMGSENAFEAPRLNNPYNVPVIYSSDDPSVASIDGTTGEITIKGIGTTTVKAVSEETEQYAKGEASYTLRVKAEGEIDMVERIIYEEPFTNDYKSEGYTVEGEKGSSAEIWYMQDGWVTAFAYKKIDDKKDIESILVSPTIKLTKENKAEFYYNSSFFTPGELENCTSLCIREVGGAWKKVEGMNYIKEWGEASTGSMIIPSEFDEKEVQFGFRYTAQDSTNAGCWQIKNFIVRGLSAKKKEAGISYGVSDMSYVIGEDGTFNAPKLNNPNNVVVTYSSSMPDVAEINKETGDVTIIGEGVTTITASSAETEEYEKGQASYILTVKDHTVIYTASFEKNECGFKEESSRKASVWTHTWDGYMHADGFHRDVYGLTAFYLVSPEITLNDKGNVVKFAHTGSFFGKKWSEQAQFAVREVGGKWVNVFGIVYPEKDNDDAISSGELYIPDQFNGKTVEVAFKYVTDGFNNSGSWYVKDLIVKRYTGKTRPNMSFDTESVEYNTDAGIEFVAPKLINTDNVEVVYSSSNTDVAEINESTGEVSIMGEGLTVISATSKETESLASAKAFYTIKVIKVPTCIESIENTDIKNPDIYNLQGMKLDKLDKGVYIINGKKYVVK